MPLTSYHRFVPIALPLVMCSHSTSPTQEIKLTGVSIPVKVVLGIAVALQVQSLLFVGRAMREWNVVVGNVVEKVNLLLLQHESCCDGVDRSVTPALVEESAILVEGLKVLDVCWAAQPVQVADFKVGPEMAVVVRVSAIIG